MKVGIPFKSRFREALLDGTKNVTSRTRKMAAPGDMFTAFGGEFRLDALWKCPLKKVAGELWKREGAVSEKDFKEIWEDIHPLKGFDPEQVVWVHEFHRIA